jgi:hypothetical protein
MGMKAGPTRKPMIPCNEKEKQELKVIVDKIQSIKL